MDNISLKGKMIDLTMTYSDQIAGFEKARAKTLAKNGWNASHLSIYSHAGTHMDAPYHFGVENKYINEYKPEELIIRGHLINLKDTKPQQLITVEMVEGQLEDFNGGDAILLRTDWSNRIGTAMYRNDLPRISVALANWCADNQVGILGVEPPSVADVNNITEVTQIHEILMKGQVTIVEGLCNLDKINTKHILLIALPLKIKNGDGAPARVVAIEQ